MKLVVAEKPSVMRDIAAVLGAAQKTADGALCGNGYIVTSARGHLVRLKQPDEYNEGYKKWSLSDLPIMPDFQFVPIENAVSVLKTLARQMNSSKIDEIIEATDAGREGECIFRYIYDYIGCTKPVRRLWISSMTEASIRAGFADLKPASEYDNLYSAGFTRSKIDWLWGINLTRLYTSYFGAKCSIGRVRTAVLNMLVQRENEISNFVKRPFYKVKLSNGAEWFDNDADCLSERIAAEKILEMCKGQPVTVKSITSQKKKENRPLLFSLTSLQIAANDELGFSAARTLSVMQSLYEKKLLTYPRTDSQYLTKDMQATAASLILWLRDNMPFGKGCAGEPDIDRVTDDSKVTDHHAIIPTVEIARTDLSELPSGERDVLTLLAVRLLCATTQVHRFEAVTAILDCQGYTFTAKGKTILQSGWKEVERIHRMSIRQSETEHKENEAVALPVLQEGQTFEAVSASLREGKTSPPKHYTEDTLLSAMETAGAEDMPEDAERKGLGTPATRAATLEKLVSAGFVQRKKKQLIPTEKGKNLIAVLPDNIKSPILTAEWESMLKQVEHGELSATSFMDQIADMSRTLVKEHTTPEERFADLFPSSRGTAHEAVGVCPRCGAPVYEGKKGFFCDNRECSFALWKDNRFFSSKKKSITKSVAAALLKEGRISMSGLYSEKTGKTYDAEVILDDTGGKYVNFKLEFPVKKGRRK